MNTTNHIGLERAGIASRTENPRAAGLIDAHTADDMTTGMTELPAAGRGRRTTDPSIRGAYLECTTCRSSGVEAISMKPGGLRTEPSRRAPRLGYL